MQCCPPLTCVSLTSTDTTGEVSNPGKTCIETGCTFQRNDTAIAMGTSLFNEGATWGGGSWEETGDAYVANELQLHPVLVSPSPPWYLSRFQSDCQVENSRLSSRELQQSWLAP